MPLLETPPTLLETTLLPLFSREQSVAVVQTDLDLAGQFAEEWLVLTDERLMVYNLTSDAVDLQLEMPVDTLTKVQVEGLIGGGALVVETEDTSIEVLRYSNAQQRKFSRIASYLNEVIAYRETLRSESSNGANAEHEKKKPELLPDKLNDRRCSSCGLPLPEGTKVCPSCMSKGKAIKRMLQYLKPHRKEVVVIWVLLIVGLLFSLVPTYLTRPLTDEVLNPVNEGSTFEGRIAMLGWLVAILLTVQVVGQVIGVWRGRYAIRLGERLSFELREDVFAHLQNLSLRYFDKRHAGSLISRVTRDTEALQNVLVESVQNFFSNILLFIGIGIVLFWMNWKLTLLVFIPAPLVIFLSRFFWERLINVWRRTWHLYSRLTSTVSDSLSGVRVVRAFAKEDREMVRFGRDSTQLHDAHIDARYMWVTFFPVMYFIMSIGNLIVWYVGGYQVIEDSLPGALPDPNAFTLGQFFAFIGYLGQFYGPLQFMSRITDFLSRSLAAAERVFEILDTESEVRDAADPRPMPFIEGRVEFKNVTFGYEPHKPVLSDISFEVRPGEMIGLVGKSGAGKSTTINLICRFYEVLEGAILIDGVDIKDISQKDLRSQIGVVLQEPFLFSGSIYDNIAFAKPDASREDIMAAAKAANAHDFIVQKPDGYDTQVGERGQTLSGGERQRVSIARAILHNPRILILDEATASVDTDTEKKIQEAIARLVKGRTTFAIAHRLSTLRNATRLVVLKKGKVAEIGTHEELMNAKGEFFRLVEIQQEMNKIVEMRI